MHAKSDLLAYVHQPHNDEPSLFLRRPGLDVLSAAKAYRLFNRFDRAVRSGANQGTFTFEDMVVIFLRTLGTHSDGFHFVGRTDGIIEPRTLGVVRATAVSFASICNQFMSGVPSDLPVPHLVVELDGSSTSVVVTLDNPTPFFPDVCAFPPMFPHAVKPTIWRGTVRTSASASCLLPASTSRPAMMAQPGSTGSWPRTAVPHLPIPGLGGRSLRQWNGAGRAS